MLQKNKCEYCARTGQLVAQQVMQAQPHLDVEKAWVFRVYMCRWHRSVQSRNSAKTVVETPFVEDSILLNAYHQSRNQNDKTR